MPIVNRSNPPSSTGTTLEETALQYLEKNPTTTVQQLHLVLLMTNPSLSRAETTDLLWRLAAEDKVELDYLPTTATFVQYLAHWEMNWGVYAALAISLATILTIYAAPTSIPFMVLRWILGSAFVLFIPGYAAVEALFPRSREMDSIERIALSVGLSLALVPLVGLILNYTPWGITLLPIVISLSVLTTCLVGIALARKYTSNVKRESRNHLE